MPHICVKTTKNMMEEFIINFYSLFYLYISSYLADQEDATMVKLHEVTHNPK